MILAHWLDARRPLPPTTLRARIDAALGADLRADVEDPGEVLLSAAERLVRSLLDADATSRGAALDLLAADALVTYAFEAASERPAELSRRAASAMARIATLGGATRRRATT
ncbi:MAG: hypothetical protein DMD35_15470 [Gemmatimonadetes bacterium]|nr:MAG: hypothetical protein DMD35_15470 [Gemmatimonadota bacterium]